MMVLLPTDTQHWISLRWLSVRNLSLHLPRELRLQLMPDTSLTCSCCPSRRTGCRSVRLFGSERELRARPQPFVKRLTPQPSLPTPL